MTPARLAALREAEKRATAGPWSCHIDDANELMVAGPIIGGERTPVAVAEVYRPERENAELIVAMRNSLPAILDALERRESLLREAQDLLYQWAPVDKSKDIGDRIDAELEGT